jgi:hypothetical protein
MRRGCFLYQHIDFIHIASVVPLIQLLVVDEETDDERRKRNMTESNLQRVSSRTPNMMDTPQNGMLSKVPEVTFYNPCQKTPVF